MGIGVGSMARAGSREICGEDNFLKSRCDGPLIAADRMSASERRAIALDADVHRALIVAAARASNDLQSAWPKFSVATLSLLAKLVPFLLGILAIAAMFTTSGIFVVSAIAVLPTAFRILTVARQNAISVSPIQSKLFLTAPDEQLPVYSVLVPLRGEARVVDQLLSGIERLNYPAEKLDVIIAVEADDLATRAAITARIHRIPITVIPVPPSEPGTKPKALNVALPYARGEFTVIYDAEDRPDQNQLLCALQAFRSARDDLACVQARLRIDTTNSWLARYFIAEYAGHFDIFLPRLAALGLPLPLGGSSNHFKTEILRQVGAWDAYNVTEDADLGMRLARLGHRCGVIDSTTYEEAPAGVCHWFGQRSRWFKGWMQTWLVHMREPLRLLHQLGFLGFLTFQLVVGGNALAALVHPLLVFAVIVRLFALDYDWAMAFQIAHCLAAAFIGYLYSGYLGWLGLSHRHVPKKLHILIWTPVHWLLLSLAAWRASVELIAKPYFWKKTEHGLDKTTWLDNTTRALLELERHLTGLKQRGELPQIWNDVRDNAANRRPRPRVAV